MKHLFLLLALVLLANAASAQQTRTEITKPTTPADDAKPNNPAVPDVYAIEGQFDQIVVLRFKYQADLLAGIERMVKERNITNAVILSGIGSVTGYHVHDISNRTFPSKNVFVKDPTAPASIISMNGYIIEGRVHAHVTMADADHSFGGHLEPGTTVFTYAMMTIGIFKDGIDLRRIDDKTYR